MQFRQRVNQATEQFQALSREALDLGRVMQELDRQDLADIVGNLQAAEQRKLQLVGGILKSRIPYGRLYPPLYLLSSPKNAVLMQALVALHPPLSSFQVASSQLLEQQLKTGSASAAAAADELAPVDNEEILHQQQQQYANFLPRPSSSLQCQIPNSSFCLLPSLFFRARIRALDQELADIASELRYEL